LITSSIGVCVIDACATNTVNPNIASLPFKISASGVRPGTILGMRPAAGLCSSPFSKYNLSWKDRGATAAQTENKRRCKCPDNRKYNPC